MKAMMARLVLAGALLAPLSAVGAEPILNPPTAADFARLAKLPDWSGLWQAERRRVLASRAAMKPALRPAAAKALAEFNAAKDRGENLQLDFANCIPPGMPEIMRMPYPIEFLVTSGLTAIVAETASQIRHVYTDGRPLPEDPDPYFNGSSVGRWEGDTLVVDTIGINPRVFLMPGVRATEKTRMQERIHLTGKDVLTIDTTITDPDLFDAPVSFSTPYLRRRDWQIKEYVCQENNHDSADEAGRPSFRLDNEK